ncbi:hypothetical protein ES703_106307 [subsurface metagenome]
MNKWIAIPVITVLAVGIIAGGYFLWQQTSKLGDAESEIVTLEGDVSTLEGNVSTLEGDISTLEGNVSTLEGNVSTLETDLAESETTVSTLEADLTSANSRISNLQSDVSTQQTINSSLSAELNKVKDPKHFATLSELVDWLDEDDTDTKYAGKAPSELSFILQVRALRDGYLLPADVDVEGDYYYVSNSARIGDSLYWVFASNDSTQFASYVSPIPSRPLPLYRYLI